MKIKLLLLTITTLISTALWAQDGGIKGRVVSRTGRVAINDAKVEIKSGVIVRSTETANGGLFEFTNVTPGTYSMTISAEDFLPITISVKVDSSAVKELGMLTLSSQGFVAGMDGSEFALFDTDAGGDAQATPMSLSASKDVYDNVASYKFGAMRFRNRGYETSTQSVYLNGIYMNDALTGYSPWSLWGGLNDATRNQESSTALGVSDYGVGMISGSTNINATASQIRKGFRASVVNANGQYRFRVMATYASGLMDNGWAYAFSASTRQGGNDWVKGVKYNAFGYFAAVEKQFNPFNTLALTVLGAPTVRGAQAAATQEIYDLVGSNYYNPNWGYQGGHSNSDIRNSRVRDYHEPIIMLNYYFTPNDKVKLQAALSYRFGKNGYSALNWANAMDPRPDYYRNLPSYFEFNNENPKAGWAKEGILNDWSFRQINWNDGSAPYPMYQTNSISHFTENEIGLIGRGLTENDLRARYIVEDRRADQNDLNAKVFSTFIIGNKSIVTAGLDYRWNKTSYFKTVKDIMGADYWWDVDQFAERDYPNNDIVIQNNLRNPNALAKEGDKFGYDYIAHLQNGKLWATYKFNYRFLEAYAAGEYGVTRFYREGRYEKGLFPGNMSYGDSESKTFNTYTAKVGAMAKIDGNNVISANFAYMTRAPYFQDAFMSPRTRNEMVPHLTTEKIMSVDLNYAFRFRGVRMRLSGYYTTMKDQHKLISFFDDLQSSYTNFAMRGIDESYAGLEFGFEAPIPGVSGLSAKGALSYGLFKYTSNPYVTQTRDNTQAIILENERVYWKDYHIGGTPQTAANLGLNYRSNKNLYLGLDASFFDALYIDMNPLYRTDFAHVNLTNEQSNNMAHQEMFNSAFILNANIGKSWYINRTYTLGFSLEVKNLLNNQDIKTGGYEQMRLYKVKAGSEVDHYVPFPSKYFYMFGTTYYLNIYFRF